MKKWILATGIVGCSLLFFISGALVGYLTSEKIAMSAETSKEKLLRKPSEKLTNLIGRVVNRQAIKLEAKVRTPTNGAIMKAKSFKSKYDSL